MKRTGIPRFLNSQVFVRSLEGICENAEELTQSAIFREALSMYFSDLREKDSPLLEIFTDKPDECTQFETILELFQSLATMEKEPLLAKVPHLACFFDNPYLLSQVLEQFYNYWRRFERFFIYYTTDEEKAAGKTPYHTFSETIEHLNHLVRSVYRDAGRRIKGRTPRVYRQVPAACQVGLIVTKEEWPCPGVYSFLKEVPFIRQILLEPPLIIDPIMNTRSGSFKKVDINPLAGLEIENERWLCYPARVGELVIHLYFSDKFMNLGTALINLFDLAWDEEVQRKPDAIYLFGIPTEKMEKFGDNKTVFYEDNENDLLIGAIPDDDCFAYFGYAKKMMLTLHNIIMMKRGRLPVHGAMAKITMKDGRSANVVILGDSGTGKSETLEAFRGLSEKYLREFIIVFDDMGSLEIEEGKIAGYGTETGAFVRLDDLSVDFAFDNIDRSIIMSPQKINARAVLPITLIEEVLRGYPVDYLLYANNFEDVDEDHPYLEKFISPDEAIHVFREGARMAKGTTNEKGLVHSYFANVFGPSQYRSLHEPIAERFFTKMFKSGLYVGQMRTRLGIPGLEKDGPEAAARALLKLIQG
ncbi:MAG: phosphoenolpyruvate carboxykinase [bacterium]|nr:phosphoenolpyruvate carboxykinase [bacterium]